MAESLPFEGRELLLMWLQEPEAYVTSPEGQRLRYDRYHGAITDEEGELQTGDLFFPDSEEEGHFGVSVAAAIWMGRLPKNDGVRMRCGVPPIRSHPMNEFELTVEWNPPVRIVTPEDHPF